MAKKPKKSLTLSEALKEGYTRYFFSDDGFQSLKDLSDADSIQWNRELELVDKEPYSPAGMSAEDIAEQLAEQIECNHTDETSDDTNQVYEAIKAIDFSDAAKKIEEALSGLRYYRSSGIKLVKD